MLHPSYSDLIEAVNSEVEPGEEKLVNSRYSIVLATAKRARQLIAGAESMAGGHETKTPSPAVEKNYNGKGKKGGGGGG